MRTQLIRTQDFSKLYLFWEQAGLKLYSKEDEQKRFDAMLQLNPDLCLLLLNDREEVVGTILGGFDGRTASIHRLAIKPDCQKQGLGSFLLQELENALKKRGVQKISAQIHISNTQVKEFYIKQGYKDMDYVINLYKDLYTF